MSFRLIIVALLVMAPVGTYGKCQTSRILGQIRDGPHAIIGGPRNNSRFESYSCRYIVPKSRSQIGYVMLKL